MTCGIECIDKWLTKAFYRLGLVVAKHPGYFLMVPVFLTAICITGFQRVKFEIDPEYLFSPEHGPGKTERAIVESHFKMNYSSLFNPTRITRPGRFGRVIVIPKQGDTMLSVEIWKELRILDDIIKNTSITWGPENTAYKYDDICARWIDQCFPNDILNLDYVMNDVVNGSLKLTFPIMFNPVTWDAHTFPVYFGGTEIDEDGLITRVPALQLVYFLTADTKAQDERGSVWEEAFLDAVGKAEDSGRFRYISTARFGSRTLDIELENNTRTVVPYFSSAFILMAVFSVVTCMMTDWVRSKPLLGLMGNVSAAMATIAAFGFAVYIGIPFIGINFVSPFLMCSIGIDDTFVMLAAWRRTPVTMDVPERLARTLSDAAVSITITSVTDIVSFCIGKFSPFPAIQIFCLYSGFAVCFIFVWHLTFFSACMAIAGYAEHNNRHSITCVKVKPVSMSDKESWLYRVFCTGGVNPKDPGNPRDNPDNAIMVWCRDSLGWALNQWYVKIMVLLVFAGYLAGALYGTTTIQEGLQRRKLSKADSYSIEFYDRDDFYFREFPYRIQVIISGELDYWDVDVQNQIENLTKTFENSSFISSPLYTESWVRSFVNYVNRNQEELNVTIDTRETFLQTLNDLWLFKPNPFSLDVKFNDDGTKIVASRFMIQAVNISDGNMEKDMVRELRKIAHDSPLNVSVFHPYFVFFDQFELVRPTSIQSMVVGGATMMLISFLFIPNVLCSLWVAFSIVSIELGVVGYMALWDVNLDTISMVNLIMCIGFSVDFTAHICYAYMSSEATRPAERVRESLYALGLPIIQGAVSTVLGVSALILAGSYIFMVFFKMIFLVIVFGALHGMILLPVLLSLFGPGACCGGGRSSRKARHPSTAALDDCSKSSAQQLHHGGYNNNGGAGRGPYCIPHPSLLQPDFGEADRRYRGGKPYAANPRPDKDMGLGTSEESSESSSSRSQRRRLREAAEDEAQRRKYLDGWRKATGHSMPMTAARPAGYGPPAANDTAATGYGQPRHSDGYYNGGRPAGYHRDERPYRNDGRYH
ncbi:patched domain-containing protein 3 [Aphis gossypii]|uniref:patched domain-containing protein 3 n=1 Tax=Aphis gossypii TaxID=80765 RepID=UPI0021594B91|nr:patched domain-containing protein 3 [Aphis gossypii]